MDQLLSYLGFLEAGGSPEGPASWKQKDVQQPTDMGETASLRLGCKAINHSQKLVSVLFYIGCRDKWCDYYTCAAWTIDWFFWGDRYESIQSYQGLAYYVS